LFTGRAPLIPRNLPIDTLDVLAKQHNPGGRAQPHSSETQKKIRRIQTKFRQDLDRIEEI
jgi:hypothetical protein